MIFTNSFKGSLTPISTDYTVNTLSNPNKAIHKIRLNQLTSAYLQHFTHLSPVHKLQPQSSTSRCYKWMLIIRKLFNAFNELMARKHPTVLKKVSKGHEL